ncbi:DUF6343 family protein [Kineococcus sp. SYSU DK004]|uniref:DUF6343 family protein n=1 Tax=Kineococcus sp. SYSU DK004 TaxID=3383125 RepID=UPI003D7E4CA4
MDPAGSGYSTGMDERRLRDDRPRVQRDPGGDEPGHVPPEQPRGRTGTEARTARSPLRLRLVLAVFGLVVCGLLSAFWLTGAGPGGARGPGIVLAVLAVVAVVDIVVVSRRLRTRARSRR